MKAVVGASSLKLILFSPTLYVTSYSRSFQLSMFKHTQLCKVYIWTLAENSLHVSRFLLIAGQSKTQVKEFAYYLMDPDPTGMQGNFSGFNL